jgi:para-nitrobenzyl esterase
LSVALAAVCMPMSASAKQPSAPPSSMTVPTNGGLVQGAFSNDGRIVEFRGIPYAAPPVGPLRFAAPQAPQSWSGVLDATGPAKTPCPQTGQYASVNEDCLYLNVFTPVSTGNNGNGNGNGNNGNGNGNGKGRLPVMVWIHPGGQTSSAANDYYPESLITHGRPVVFVSFNYRLNIFAFFAHKALTAEIPQLGSGNYAGLDQQQALRWVRDNIANFGGDPGNVTIFGQSGGAQAVCVLLASPPAKGLFHKAISESGSCQWELYPSLTASENKGAKLAEELGCAGSNPLPCLRALPASAILAKQANINVDTSSGQPAWGNGAFPMPMRETMVTGQMNQVPLIQGGTKDEAMFSVGGQFDGAGKPVTAAQYPQLLEQYFGASRVEPIMAQYPLSDYATPSYAFLKTLSDSAVGGRDRTGACNVNLANKLASPHIDLYAYEFADDTAQYPAPIYNPPNGDLVGASHTDELSYLFDNVPLTAKQRQTADVMINYWTNFAATGNPNGKGLPNWPVYEPTKPNVMLITANSIASDRNFAERHKCKFWNEQGYNMLAGPYPTPTATGPVNQ